MERNSRASSLFKVSVEETRSGKEGRLTIKVDKLPNRPKIVENVVPTFSPLKKLRY